MAQKYHLIDYTHDKKRVKLDKMYRTASKIALKYGCMGDGSLNYNQDRICEFWEYEDNYPCFASFLFKIRVSVIKWYIHNEIQTNEKIWTPDFLRGLLSNAKISWNKFKFPSCHWLNNEDLYNVLLKCPYGGKLLKYDVICRWSYVPALYLKHSEDSIQFMAGLMAGLKLVEMNGYKYAMSNVYSYPYLKKWGIPIESKEHRRILISPIWPALFVKYMPEEDKWLNIKNASNVNIYAPILWKTYINNQFVPDGIPYLRSRRAIYYDYKCDEGAMHRLDLLRVEKGMTELDNRVKEVVKQWHQDSLESRCNTIGT